jgi:hypothetical protein
MTLPTLNVETPAQQTNMRLVLVDDKQQPAYLKRAAQLEKKGLTPGSWTR